MAESARAGPTDLNGAGPSSPRLLPPSPRETESMDVDDPAREAVKMDVNGHLHESDSTLVNATATTEKRPQSSDLPSTSVPSSTSRMDPPPDSMRPPSRSRGDTPNGVHFAADLESIVNPDPFPEPDQAMSAAQSIAGSTSTSKPRNKRKRGPLGSARRASTIDKDRPPHYLGPDNQTIRCICGTEADTLTAQCDTCGAWEHALCFGYPEDADALPDNFYCELCEPRPVDRERARALQLANMEIAQLALDTQPGPVKPRPKGRRQKSEMGGNDGNDPSPTTAKPPSLPTKPKRRQPGAKPRSAKASITDTAPSPAAAAASSRAVASEAGRELDDPFFREPWTMQFSPLRHNLPKGARGEHALRRLNMEWLSSPEEERDLKLGERQTPARRTPNGHEPTPDPPADLPDLSILAAPIPPINLIGPDIEALAAQVAVKPVRDSVNFLPRQYEGDLSPDDLSHPANYAVYAKSEIPAGSFIGEFRGEVGPSQAYQRDTYNQYESLGVPKPHVRAIGPPINLSIDARFWGTRLRYIRSSCHPNAVLRLIRFRKTESDPARLGFGLFANTTIRARAEITLSWDWDDQHLVHTLERMIEAASNDDAGSGLPLDETAASLAEKCDSVLLSMYGVFATGACTVLHHCAFHQMKYIVDHREEMEAGLAGFAEGRNTAPELGELIGAVRGFRRQEPTVATARRRSPGWGMRPFNIPVVKSAEKEVEVVSEGEEAGQESMEVDNVEGPATAERSANIVASPDMDIDMTPPPEEKQPEVNADTSMDSQHLDTTLPTIPESSPLHLAPSTDVDVTPLSRVVTHQELMSKVFASPNASSVLSAAPSQEPQEITTQAPRPKVEAPKVLETAENDGNESDATTATIALTDSQETDLESEDDRPPTPPRRSAPREIKKEVVKANGKLAKGKGKPVPAPEYLSDDDGLSSVPSKHSESSGELTDEAEEASVAESVEEEVPLPPVDPRRSKYATKRKVPKPPRVTEEVHTGRKYPSPDPSFQKTETGWIIDGRVYKRKTNWVKREVEAEPESTSPVEDLKSKPRSTSPVKVKKSKPRSTSPVKDKKTNPRSTSPVKVTRSTARSAATAPIKEATPEPVKEPTPEPIREPTPEPVKEPTPEPVKEPTPPPPPKHVSLAEYVRLNKQRKEETAKPTETAAPPTPAATVEPPPAPVPEVTQLKVDRVDDGGIPGFKYMSPLKPVDPLPVVNGNGSSASPATRQAELDNRFNLSDHLPTHGSASQTPALETPTNGSASTTPGLGLTKGDYFPQQPTSQISSSYVPRGSRPAYVPRAQGSISRTSESPAIDDYLPRPGSSSAQSQSAPLPRIPSGSSSYVPRPSPSSEQVPLPPPAMSQSTSSSSSNYHRISPYRPPAPLPVPAEPSIPPPAVREAPPHATFRPPPTGPKVPPKGPRTSGGSASGGFVPPRDRDRDWEARDRERDRDRERERERDREPVSPRATFGVGSARGGAYPYPVPVPFHRGRGRGLFRGGPRGGSTTR
jgi:hypothetical protein